jgi:farnesyl diphosphate synthase
MSVLPDTSKGPRVIDADSPPVVEAMNRSAALTNDALGRLLPKREGPQKRVHEAMHYAVFAGGKRFRPFLVLHSAAIFDVDQKKAIRVAAAIEALHSYSLVHDDLPCMDDDDLRRGRPTTHRAYDEATAVLAGDALLTVAFEILSSPETHDSAEIRSRLVLELARAAGSNGMIGGQMIDMQASQTAHDLEAVLMLQRLKTGALIEFCCIAGAILGQAGRDDEERLGLYARDIGLLFQITDDLLDETSTSEKTGKAVGKDRDQGKATVISLLGIDAARKKAKTLAAHAKERLIPYGPAADMLRHTPEFLLHRES